MTDNFDKLIKCFRLSCPSPWLFYGEREWMG